jgi:hypothetical protein
MQQHRQNELEQAAVECRLGAAIVESNATIQDGLEKLVDNTGTDEIIVVTDTYEHRDRLESYQRVAEIAGAIKMKLPIGVSV